MADRDNLRGLAISGAVLVVSLIGVIEGAAGASSLHHTTVVEQRRSTGKPPTARHRRARPATEKGEN